MTVAFQGIAALAAEWTFQSAVNNSGRLFRVAFVNNIFVVLELKGSISLPLVLLHRQIEEQEANCLKTGQLESSLLFIAGASNGSDDAPEKQVRIACAYLREETNRAKVCREIVDSFGTLIIERVDHTSRV